MQLTSGSFVSETEFRQILPNLQDYANGVRLSSTLDLHGTFGRLAISGGLQCPLIAVATQSRRARRQEGRPTRRSVILGGSLDRVLPPVPLTLGSG